MSPRTGHPLVTLAAIVLGFSGLPLFQPAHAQTGQKPAAQPTTYQVETGSSRVYIKVDAATRLGHVHGVQGNLASGTVTLGGTGDLVFDMTSFQADTPQARQYVGLDPRFSQSDAQKVTANMLSADVLDVSQFPRAVYAISSITPTGGQAAGEPGQYLVDGRFTLHGTAQLVRFPATLSRTDRPGVLRLTGAFSVLQTSYGIRPYSALGGLARVADQLQIWGDLVLIPATP
jgi:polyisoprenoid-binding protein YceI